MQCDESSNHQSLHLSRFLIVAVCGGTAALFGVIANALLAKLFVTKSNYRHSPYFFLGFVATFDTLLDLSYIFLLAIPMMSEYFEWPGIYTVWTHFAHMLYSSGQIFKMASVFSLIVASFERYLMTKHWTFTGFEYRSRWIILISLVGLAIFIKLFTAMQVIVIVRTECKYPFHRYVVGQHSSRSWLIGFLNMLTIMIPFVTLIFLNGGIVLMLRQQNVQQLRSLITELTMGHDVMKIRKRTLRAATNTLIVIISIYLISNILNLLISLVEYIHPGLLQRNYPYHYRLGADIASALTVIGNALRCPAHVWSNKDIRHQLLCWDNIKKHKKTNATASKSDRIDNPPWISVLLLNHDDPAASDDAGETSNCIRHDGLQVIFEHNNIRRVSNVGIC